mgnify:CR=1 FL=1
MVQTNKGVFETSFVVNAAGVYADAFHNMVSRKKLSITPRKGEYCLMDKKAGSFVSHTIFQLPTAMGKGVLITPTVHGNLLAGPTAEDISDKEGVQTTAHGIEKLSKQARVSAKNYSATYDYHFFCRASGYRGWWGLCIRRTRGCAWIFWMQRELSHRGFPVPLPLACIWQRKSAKSRSKKESRFPEHKKGYSLYSRGIKRGNTGADCRRSGLWKCDLPL